MGRLSDESFEQFLESLKEAGIAISNETELRARLAEAMHLSFDAVSIKATTTEGMNDEGRGLCISASAIASLV